MRSGAESGRSEGFALVTVLWACMILSLIMIGLLRIEGTAALVARNRLELQRLSMIADGAITLVAARLSSAGPLTMAPDGTPFSLSFAGQDVRLTVQDEAGKIDLNAANEDLLRGLLGSAGLDTLAAQALADKILDWREPGPNKRLNGAKADDYRLAGYAYGPRGGPFESIGELTLVMGMTAPLFERLAPALTVNSQQSGIDPNVAPAEVLRALPGMTEETVATFLEARAANGAGLLPAANRSGRVYTIGAETEEGEIRVRRQATVRLSGDRTTPVWVYGWQ